MKKNTYRGHRFPPAIIQVTVWMYARFTLSLRDVEELLAERGLDISHETVRRWFLKVGQAYARRSFIMQWLDRWLASGAADKSSGRGLTELSHDGARPALLRIANTALKHRTTAARSDGWPGAGIRITSFLLIIKL